MVDKIHYNSSWTLPPTGKQVRAITRLCMQLGIKEPLEESPSNRWEARRLLYELNEQMAAKNKGGKEK